MLINEWTIFCRFVQKTCAILALLIHTFSIFIVLRFSPKKVGSYKYLLAFTSCFEIVYSLVDALANPIIHSFPTRVIAFTDLKNSLFGREVNVILGLIFSGLYGFSMTIFGINFIHRYGSLDKVYHPKFLGKRSATFWCLVPVVCCLIWSLTIYFVFTEDPAFTELIRFVILEQYDLRVEDIFYAGPYIFTEHSDGERTVELNSVLGMLVLLVILKGSLLAVLYFGIKCYQLIRKTFSSTCAIYSRMFRNLQRELFNALVIQTSIPLLLLYLPISVVLTCTILLIDIGNASGSLCITIALYPVIDALPTLLVVRHYRQAAMNYFRSLGRIILSMLSINQTATENGVSSNENNKKINFI